MDGRSVYMGNNHSCPVVGIRSIPLKLEDGSVNLLKNVRHVPKLKRNLIALGMLDSIGCKYRGKGGYCEVWKDSKLMLKGVKINGVYVVQGVQKLQLALVVTYKEPTNGDLWHKRLAHISAKGLQALANQEILLKGVHQYLSFCEHCVVGKAKRHSFTKPNIQLKESLATFIHIFGILLQPHL